VVTGAEKKRRSPMNGYGAFDVFLIALMVLIVSATLYPVLLVVSLSISDPFYVMSREVFLLPKGFSLESYAYLLNIEELWTAYGNTIFYTVAGTAINVVMTSVLAYCLSRRTFALRNHILFLMTVTMFFGGGLIPNFLNISRLGLYNNRLVMLLPPAISAYNVIVARTFFYGIPEEMHESAVLDGANEWKILTRVYLPLSMPIIAVLTLFYAVGHWNSFFPALLYLPDKMKQPVNLYLRRVVNDTRNMTDMSTAESVKKEMLILQMKYSVIVVVMLPIICVYPFIQKYFVKGVMIGAIKS